MKNRVLWKMFALSIVTIGIYRLYWFIKTRREMMDLNPSIKILSPYFLLIPIAVVLVTIGVFIAALINSPDTANCSSDSNYSYSSKYNSDEEHYNSNDSKCDDSAAALIGIGSIYGGLFIAYILFVVWLWSYAQGVEIITGGKLSFAMSLVVLILVPDGFDILIVQDAYNKLNPASAAPSHTPPSSPAAHHHD